MSNSQMKVVHEHPLPATSGRFCLELTGQWTVIEVTARFGKPCLYTLEDTRGPKTENEFIVIGIDEPIASEQVTGRMVPLGSYAVPGNMLHVFGPKTSAHQG